MPEKYKDKFEGKIKILDVLKKTYPDAHCELKYSNPFELMVATILSAQCTDVRVNMVTPSLFKKFPTPQKMAKAEISEVEEIIRSTGFYKNKARSIVTNSQKLMSEHGGEIPRELEKLVELPGIGRKTANVVLGNAFGIPGLVVDTHVGRLSRRMGFTKETDPVKIEHALMKIVPKEDWTLFSHLLIFHGRRRCMARNPDCENCEVFKLCPKIGVVKKAGVKK